MSLFSNKTLMITGGTGSFGNAVLNRFLKTDIGEIRIFSRDEKKTGRYAPPFPGSNAGGSRQDQVLHRRCPQS